MRSRQHDPKCRLKSSHVKPIYFNHPSWGNSTNYYVILGPRDKAVPPTSQQIKKSLGSEWNISQHRHPFLLSFFLIHRRALCSQPIRDNVHWTGRMFPEHVEQSFLDPKYSFITVQWILQTIFMKQKFTQLRTSYICPKVPVMFANKCLPN